MLWSAAITLVILETREREKAEKRENGNPCRPQERGTCENISLRHVFCILTLTVTGGKAAFLLSSFSSSQAMTDRGRKREWLRLIGAVDDNEPSGSAKKVLTPNLIDATLGSIQGDDIWVALACLDAIENNTEVFQEVAFLKHFTNLGLRRSELARDVDMSNQQEIYMLAIRKVLLQYKRMTDVWEQVYSNDVDTREVVEDSTKDEGDADDYDAWEEETPIVKSASMMSSIPLAIFIKQDPLRHAMHLASTHQSTILQSFIKSLPAKLISDVYPYRLAITKELLLSAYKVKSDLSQLNQLRLLPGIANGKETDVWTDLHENAENSLDLTDTQEAREALNLHRLNRSMEMEEKGYLNERIAEEYLSPASLLAFYSGCIDQLAHQTTSILSSIDLATIVMSEKLNLPADESIVRLYEDLRMLLPLIQGSASSSSCSSWTIQRFREELIARPVLAQKQAMATLYLDGARSQQDALDAARNGAVPFIRTITQRYASLVGSTMSVEDGFTNGFVHSILALADKAQFRIMTYLLEGSAQCGVRLQTIERGRITLACQLGTANLDASVRQDLDRFAMSTITALKEATGTDKERPLREYIGSALHQGLGRPLPPSQIYFFFASLSSSTLKYHIERCRMYIDLCQRFTRWNISLTVPWLTNAQGQREDQVACVTRIIRSFARDAKAQDQWTTLTIELMGSVGMRESFDMLKDKDVARLIAEGSLRTSDARIYSRIIKETCSAYLDDQEQEEMVLQASREFYDNATSANVHQGDMKTAHEILSQSGLPVTTRIQQEKSFIEATSRLCSFKIQSKLRPGVFLAPIEIRLSPDRMDLIKRLLESKEDAYKTPDLILDLALKLCVVPSGTEDKKSNDEVPSRSLVESRTLSLLIEAALGQADYEQAQSSCERLVANVTAVGKRVEQSAASHGQQHQHLEILLQQIKEYAYRSCFFLSNQQEWRDYANRLRWCSYVLAYCPDDQVERYLKTWRRLEQEFQQDLLTNPPKNWDQVAFQLKAGQGGLASSSLALIGGLGAFESLSPFSTFFAGNRKASISKTNSNQDETSFAATANSVQKEDSIPGRVGSPASRAARLFDSLGGGGNNTSGDQANGTYLDPAERAARAARRFFGGFG